MKNGKTGLARLVAATEYSRRGFVSAFRHEEAFRQELALVVVGLLLARFVQSLVSSGAATANLVYARQLGSAAHGAVVVMVGVLTAQQLGVDTRLLMTVITALIAAAALAVGLARASPTSTKGACRAPITVFREKSFKRVASVVCSRRDREV